MIFSVDFLCTGVPLLHLQAEKGRLNQDEIDRMVKEAEEFADQDKAIKAKIDAKNQLETYIYQIKSTVEDKAKDKVGSQAVAGTVVSNMHLQQFVCAFALGNGCGVMISLEMNPLNFTCLKALHGVSCQILVCK